MTGKAVIRIVYPQPFEKLPVAAKRFFNRIEKQRFAEPPRARQKIIARVVYQVIDIPRLVDIDKAAFDYFSEAL